MRSNRMLRFVLCVLLAVGFILPVSVYAQEANQKVVRVGWYES